MFRLYRLKFSRSYVPSKGEETAVDMHTLTDKWLLKGKKRAQLKVERLKMVLRLMFFQILCVIVYNLWNFHDHTCLGRGKIDLSKRETCLTLTVVTLNKCSKKSRSVSKWCFKSSFFEFYNFHTISSEIFKIVRARKGQKTAARNAQDDWKRVSE